MPDERTHPQVYVEEQPARFPPIEAEPTAVPCFIGYTAHATRVTGETLHLPSDAFTVTSLETWTSPHTGAVYPSGWTIDIPGEELALTLTPTVLGQELDTRRTTGVVYWEGSQIVEGMRAGEPVSGKGYVELTGYAP